MTLFDIQSLRKVYGSRTVLNVSELHLEEGGIYTLLGPNGSGKTTLLEILALLTPPTSGEIRYRGMTISGFRNNPSRLRREIVMVHQNPILFTTTVRKNVAFGLKIRRVPKRERGKIVDACLDLVGMRGFAESPAHRLSGGETQRVAIARALACSPRVMLFDEPTANVDLEHQFAIEQIIQEINLWKGITILFATHDLRQAYRGAGRVIPLYEGAVSQSPFGNIFTGEIRSNETGRGNGKICRIHDAVQFPVITEKTGKVKITLDPSKVAIHPAENRRHAHGGFPGTLIQLTDEEHHVRATVDIGVPIHVLLDKGMLQGMSVSVGEDVWVSWSPEDVQIL